MKIFLFDRADAEESRYLAMIDRDDDILADVGMAITEGWTHPEKDTNLLHGDLSEAQRRNKGTFYLAPKGSESKRQVWVVGSIGKGAEGINLIFNRGI